MKSLRKKLSAAAIAAIAGNNAQAGNLRDQMVLDAIRPGAYYHLTPQAARALNIDMAVLTEAVKLQKSQQLAFQVQEDGELNLSIYNEGAFVRVMSDIVKQALKQ